MLRIWLEMAGYVVVTAFTHAIRDAKTDLAALMMQHRPRVIVYDVAFPYEANWRLFKNIRESPATQGACFVLTTTNAKRVTDVAGEEAHGILEIVDKPYDADQLTTMIATAFLALGPSGPA
jgi:CheY-like chemotaxis protein